MLNYTLNDEEEEDEGEEGEEEGGIDDELYQVRQEYNPPPQTSKPQSRKPRTTKGTTVTNAVRTKPTKEEIWQAWQDYFTKYPEEAIRLQHLKKINPNEFRALTSNLPGAAARHPGSTLWFLAGCLGISSMIIFTLVFFSGALDVNKGWKAARSQGAVPKVLELLYTDK